MLVGFWKKALGLGLGFPKLGFRRLGFTRLRNRFSRLRDV
jgi:hypothetical protein